MMSVKFVRSRSTLVKLLQIYEEPHSWCLFQIVDDLWWKWKLLLLATTLVSATSGTVSGWFVKYLLMDRTLAMLSCEAVVLVTAHWLRVWHAMCHCHLLLVFRPIETSANMKYGLCLVSCLRMSGHLCKLGDTKFKLYLKPTSLFFPFVQC